MGRHRALARGFAAGCPGTFEKVKFLAILGARGAQKRENVKTLKKRRLRAAQPANRPAAERSFAVRAAAGTQFAVTQLTAYLPVNLDT